MLNWQTDPLLLDPSPVSFDTWVTANQLLSQDTNSLYSFLDPNTLTLNLYSLLIRKIDFVRDSDGDRILSRFPFLVLTEDELTILQSKILLIAQAARDYFYKSINENIIYWKRRIQNYLKRGALPFPLYRCSCALTNLSVIHNHVDLLFFESARGKRYTLPTKLTNGLAYLCGVCNGDGHLTKHWLRITDETKDYMLFLSKVFEYLFHDPGEVFPTGNAWNAELRSSAVSRLINFITDQPLEGAKYDSLREPLLFQQLGAPFRNLFWRGAMDADGSFKNQISFTSASEQFNLDYQVFLDSIGILSSLKQNESDTFGLYLPAKHKLNFVESIGVLNPKKSEDLLDFLQGSRNYVTFTGLKKNVLTTDGYFNFNLMDSLYIIGLGHLLEKYRADRSCRTMDELLDLSHNSYTKMEKNERSLPYNLLKTILNDDENQIYDILENNMNEIRFQVSNSNSIQLPLKPCKQLDEILPYLEPKLNYVLVNENERAINQPLEEIFGVSITDNRITCRILVHFLSTFYNYTTDTPTLTIKEFYDFKKKWREELFS